MLRNHTPTHASESFSPGDDLAQSDMQEGSVFYLHGFRSGPQSGKLLSLRDRMTAIGLGHRLWAEQLHWGPRAAISQISNAIIASKTTPTLVGSSLGGFYAAYLAERFGLRAVLINPVIAPHRLLSQWLGTQTQLYTGEAFEVLPAQLDELQSLQVGQYSQPENLWLLAEMGDEVLDYREAVAHFAGVRQTVLPGGDHRFTRWESYLDEILRFANLMR